MFETGITAEGELLSFKKDGNRHTNVNLGQDTRANRTRHTSNSSTKPHAKHQHTNAHTRQTSRSHTHLAIGERCQSTDDTARLTGRDNLRHHRFTHATQCEFRRVGCGAFRRCAYNTSTDDGVYTGRRHLLPHGPCSGSASISAAAAIYANVLRTWDQQGKTLRADHGGPRPRVCSCGSQRRARRRLQTETGRGEVVWNVQL